MYPNHFAQGGGIQPRQQGGIYPGAGIARGGQQGKAPVFTGAIGSMGGGNVRPGASPAGPPMPTIQRPKPPQQQVQRPAVAPNYNALIASLMRASGLFTR